MSQTSYTPIIGMEIHVQLKTKSKMFSPAPNNPNEQHPNTNINPIDLGHPGTLPVPNKEAIRLGVLVGTALGCTIREQSKFDRKHYFYPDLPKGYQISQYDEPIAEHGSVHLSFVLEDNPREQATISIVRAHLEEDTAKLSHDTDGSTLVDFNRAGIPLIEIVTGPDFQSGKEAKRFCEELQLLLRYLGASDAELEKGHMRCEANISVQETGKFTIENNIVVPFAGYKLNPKVEIKNMSSFKAIERAVAYEIERQTGLLEQGETWEQQTRGWDEATGKTVMQRKKESAHDYRYFPEPDIPPFHPKEIAGKILLPELPQQKRKRFHKEYGFSYADAALLSADKAWANFTDAVMSELINWLYNLPEVQGATDEIKESYQAKIARLAGGWITSKLVGALNERNQGIEDFKISPENFAEFISLIYTDRINSTNAQKLLRDMIDKGTDADPTHIMEEKGYGQVSDESTILEFVQDVINQYPEQVQSFRDGKEPIIKFLIGMVMRASEGSADPAAVEKLLREELAS
jgi:aspartyl-tRNA(Asn)/glutamyl-tRNA(Gln) amidotransferase subunit B